MSQLSIALLRGINVGGTSSVSMKDLAACFEAEGAANVRTYIQSGNVVFEWPGRWTKQSLASLQTRIEKACGISPDVMVLPAKDLQAIANANPFPEAEADPKTLHVFFLAERPKSIDQAGIEAVRLPEERVEVIGKACYLHAPAGVGRSKLAAVLERRLGVRATARNWNTVVKLLELAYGD